MAIIHRCEVCKKTPHDYDREGFKRAKTERMHCWGTPAVKKRLGAWVCDFCLEAMAALYESERRPAPAPMGLERPTITPGQRWTVWERDNYTCRKCGARRPLAVDHVVPLCLGGEHHERNMQTLCVPCNRSKGGRMPKAVEFQ